MWIILPLLSVEDRGRYFGKRVFCNKTNVIYLLLSTKQAELAKLKLIILVNEIIGFKAFA